MTGLQRERTALAWNRTAVALVVAGAVFVTAGGSPYHPARHTPGLVAIVLGAVFVAHKPRTGVVAARAMTFAAIAFSLSALGLVLFGG
ncbi:MAG: DUF202 domain-containing protein [Egibacteraceae bacterium]